MELLKQPTPNLFFTGKGGVGKTSMACAVAVALADRGRRVLLVSTDPASNLDEVLGDSLEGRPTVVSSVTNLWALNIDPESAAHNYRERMVGPYRDLLPPAAVQAMKEQFSGACTVEIAAFDEFARLLGDAKVVDDYDHVVFDTASTGHTLRLLSLPSAWDGFMSSNTTGTSCLGPLAGLQSQQQVYRDTVAALSDATRTTVILVSRPELAALREADRTSHELANLGVNNQQLLINGLFVASEPGDPIADAMECRGRDALAQLPSRLGKLPQTTIPLSSRAIMGVESLRAVFQPECRTPAGNTEADIVADPLDLSAMSTLIDEIASTGHGVILTMGKGGVGKTTIAATVAVALADRGFPVHLTTTDPAAHITTTLDGDLPNLRVTRIDPRQETDEYSAEVMNNAGAGLDENGRALLAEDLRSPCTEEIAVFRAFARSVALGDRGFVVLDTAPTGHTILLLDAALAYHREAARQANSMPAEVHRLLPRLRDTTFTRVLIVTLPEATPVHEAAALQRDLRRADIHPYAWIVNQSLTPLCVHDPLLRLRQRAEHQFIAEVAGQLTSTSVLVPWQIAPPVGINRLRELSKANHAMRSPSKVQ